MLVFDYNMIFVYSQHTQFKIAILLSKCTQKSGFNIMVLKISDKQIQIRFGIVNSINTLF